MRSKDIGLPKRLIRKITIKKVKQILELTGISIFMIVLVVLLEPFYTFLAKLFYAYVCFFLLLRVWIAGMNDWEGY